jgi:competence protein ComFB
MPLADRYDMDIVKNRSAEMVQARVEELLAAGGQLCPCQECVLDLVAYALNRVSPHYTTSLLGSLHSEPAFDRKLRVEIDVAIAAGLKRLRQHPHHAER